MSNFRMERQPLLATAAVAAIGRVVGFLGLPGCRPWPIRYRCFLYRLVCRRRNNGALHAMTEMTPQDELKEAITGAVARGWCAKANEEKEFDADLANAIFAEV